MDDTVKLIIEIPKPMYESIQNGTYCGTLYEELKNGIPLENMIADIKNCEIRHDFRIAEKDTKSRELMHGIFSDVYGVLARIGKTESEDK